jgi:hypothetical protein
MEWKKKLRRALEVPREFITVDEQGNLTELNSKGSEKPGRQLSCLQNA